MPDGSTSLPRLDGPAWEATRRALHQATRVLGSIRAAASPALPNELRHGVHPQPRGASTGALDFGGEFELDYVRASVYFKRNGTEVFALPLAGYHQQSFFAEVLGCLDEHGIAARVPGDKIVHEEPFSIDTAHAAAYADVQWRMFRAIARAKSRMYGPQTPITLWPHGFDLSTIWFASGMDEKNDPHVNFGFSPGTEDIPGPYVYVYAWPAHGELLDTLSEGWVRHDGWSTPGAVLHYADLAIGPDPIGRVAELLTSAYSSVAPRLAREGHASNGLPTAG